MNDGIHTVEELEAHVGAMPASVNLKVIDHLDSHAQRWLAASPLAFAGFSDARRVEVTLAGGAPGFAATRDSTHLRLPRGLLDDPGQALAGRGVGLLFLVPGLGETLRINGRVAAVEGGDILISVQECYAHCAKALLRSEFWRPHPDGYPDPGISAFLAASRFMALATADADLHTDVSPKGDPAGALVQAFEGGVRFADRPGNRRTDSFRNILARPYAAAVLIVPGCTHVAVVQGSVAIRTDLRLREAFIVQDKMPALVTSFTTGQSASPVVHGEAKRGSFHLEPKAPPNGGEESPVLGPEFFTSPAISLRESQALVRAMPWTSSEPPADIDPAEIFTAHVKLNKTRGLRAALARRVVSIPGLMRQGLEQDYKRNLY